MMNTLFRRLPARLTGLCALSVILASCASTPAPVSLYDFGTASPSTATSSCDLPPVYVADISASAALDTNLMLYRLLYDNEQESHAYANHRWSTTPAQLLAVRIKSQLTGNGVRLVDLGMANPGGWQLRLDLTDFTQYFSDATHSYAQLELRASVLRANQLVAQTTFKQRATADSPDAPAGARAMRNASDTLIADLSGWLCKLPK